MEEKLGEIYVEIIARQDKLQFQLNKISKDIENQGTKMSNSFGNSFSKGISIFLSGAILYKVVNFFRKTIDAINGQKDAEAELAVQLGFTSQALIDQASALQMLTKFTDDDIIATQARIAAFTKDEEKIKLLTKATLDFAAAKKTDLTNAGDLLAKTIGGEMNVLGRYGIKVDGAAGSTKRLMQVVEGVASLYGGMAEAQGKTFSGRLEILKHKVDELEEGIGAALVPTLEKVVDVFGKVADSSQKTTGFFQGVAVAGRILGSVFIVIKTSLIHVGSLLGTIGAVLVAMATLQFKLIPKIVEGGFNAITSNSKEMIDGIYNMWTDLDKKLEQTSTSPRKGRGRSGSLSDDEKKAYKAKFDADLKYQDAKNALIRSSIRDQMEADRQAISDRLQMEIAAITERGKTEKISKATIDKEIAAASLQASADLVVLLRNQAKEKADAIFLNEKTVNAEVQAFNELIDTWINRSDEEWKNTNEKIRTDNLNAVAELGNALQGAFSRASDDFISKLNQALQIAINIANAIQAAETAKGVSGPLGILSSILGIFGLFGAQGGSFQNGRKIASFAGGGSMMVPYTGLSGDSYPIMVKGGERVDVTPNYAVGNKDKMLGELVGRVESLTIAVIKGNNKKIEVPLYINNKLIGEAIIETQNEFDRGNVKVNR